jgi:(p)ppGpp synthase/HD superfamily hydrolase
MAPRGAADLLLDESPLLQKAAETAQREHAGQSRKANQASYFDHVLRVAAVLREAGFDDEVVAAALLHDTAEHTALELEDIRSRFGERIGALVEAMSDREEIEDWEQRKAEHRERVSAAGRDAVAIYAADKLCGVREARDGYAEIAEGVEERLGNSLDLRLRAWEEDLRMVAAIEPPLPITAELERELAQLREDRLTSPSRP